MGLEMVLAHEHPDWSHPAIRRHSAPSARLELGRAVREIPATAAIDLSDGLAIDANRLATASRVSVVIDPASLPLFPGASRDAAIRSGEEHELLFTVADPTLLPDRVASAVIGRVDEGTGVWLDTGDGLKRLRAEGFSHF